jgi:Adenine specific DNA methylase Mod
MAAVQKLELTWIGKDKEERVESRILIYDKEKSYGDQNTGNMLIHGDNLLALKSLEQDYAGKVKCIYIDPPFNTGEAFENYDDNMELSLWLNLMRCRLRMLYTLLSEQGTIFIHIDDGNLGYLLLLLDEIFGRKNRLYTITFKQGAATGHKAINPGCVTTTNFILMYAKNKTEWNPNRVFTKRERDTRYGKYITNIEDKYKNWQISTLTEAFADFIGKGIKETRRYIKENPQAIDKFVIDNSKAVIRTAQPDIKNVGKDIQEKVLESKTHADHILYLERVNHPDMYFLNGERILFYKDKLKNIDGKLVSGEPLTTLWDDILSNNLHNEGDVRFPKGKKPEHLVKRLLELSTEKGDLILDSFLGSGTTAAVAHKMSRRYIGIEMGEQCYTHCKVRLDKVVDGEQGGISKTVNWQGGSGYRFYELAPSMLKKDKHNQWVFDYDAYEPEQRENMIAEAIAKLNGYHYAPDEDVFWKQGMSQSGSYIYTTMQYISSKYMDGIFKSMNGDERLLVCCPAFDNGLGDRYDNIVVKKIPQAVLDKCEFGREDYKINIIETPDKNEEADEVDDDE